MTAAENPLDVLRETYDAVTPNALVPFDQRVEYRRRFTAALSTVEQLVEAARAIVEEWDWPADDGSETEFHDRVMALAAALARFPVPAAVRSREQQEPQA